MKQKKDLAKLALTALIVAAAAPAGAQQLSHSVEGQGVYLATGCKAHGCATVADNGSGQSGYYNPSRSSQTGTTGNQGYMSDSMPAGSYNSQQSTSKSTLSEVQLLSQLNAQARSIYFSLDSEGKALALQLASQASNRDKNQAVMEAQRRINEQRGMSR